MTKPAPGRGIRAWGQGHGHGYASIPAHQIGLSAELLDVLLRQLKKRLVPQLFDGHLILQRGVILGGGGPPIAIVIAVWVWMWACGMRYAGRTSDLRAFKRRLIDNAETSLADLALKLYIGILHKDVFENEVLLKRLREEEEEEEQEEEEEKGKG
jgi:hypothetical protein